MRLNRFMQQRSAIRLPQFGAPMLMSALGILLFFYQTSIGGEAPTFAPLPDRPAPSPLTNPVPLVSPARLNFGSVPIGKSATNTFLVENFGGGKLVGKASVHAPFKIVSGETYALRSKEVQIVMVMYA